MKNVKKLLAMALTAIMAVSAMSISAMAKTEIKGEDGVVLVMYDEDERASLPMPLDVDQEAFSQIIGCYPSWSPLKLLSTGKTSLAVDKEQSVLQIDFNKKTNKFTSGYLGLYDITAGKYIIKPNQYLSFISNEFAFTNLTGGHSYRILMAGEMEGIRASGIVWSY